MKRYLVLLSLGAAMVYAALAGTASTRQTTPSQTGAYVITGVNVIDVEKGIAIGARTVTIVGDRIEKIQASEATAGLASARQIDGRGLYLVPGLVDAHVHYFDSPVFGRLMLANGVLLVRDMGMPNEYILPLRDSLNRGDTLGPEMAATGAILDGDPPLIGPISLGLKTPEEGRAAVRAQAKAGANMIKVYSRLDKEVFLAIVDEARKLGLKAVGHVPEPVDLEEAAAAGLGSSEHFFGFEKLLAKLLGEPVRLQYSGMGANAECLQRLDEVKAEALRNAYQRLAASGLTVCPTVVTFKTQTHVTALLKGEFPGSEYISGRLRETWKQLWSQQDDLPDFIWRKWASMVKGLNEAGVPLLLGTDLMLPGIIPGSSVHEEMAIWQEAGIPPADVLRGATIVPARFMGLDDRLGTIAEGKTASMVLVRADPLQDVRNLRQIEGVFLRGRYFSRGDLDRLLREAKDLAQQKPGR